MNTQLWQYIDEAVKTTNNVQLHTTDCTQTTVFGGGGCGRVGGGGGGWGTSHATK